MTKEIESKVDEICLVYPVSERTLAWRKPFTVESFLRSAKELYDRHSAAPSWPESRPVVGIMYLKEREKVLSGPIPAELDIEGDDTWHILRKAVQEADSPRINVLKRSVQL